MTLKAETQGHHLDFAETVTKSSCQEFTTPFNLGVLSSPYTFVNDFVAKWISFLTPNLRTQVQIPVAGCVFNFFGSLIAYIASLSCN